MKKFTAIAGIVLPLSLLASMFGMNVIVPGEEWPERKMWFYLLCGFMTLISMGMAIVFRHFDWL